MMFWVELYSYADKQYCKAPITLGIPEFSSLYILITLATINPFYANALLLQPLETLVKICGSKILHGVNSDKKL